MSASVTAHAAWIEAVWTVQGWLRPYKLLKTFPFQTFTSAGVLKTLQRLQVLWSSFFAFCNLLLTFYSVLHQFFPLLLRQYEWWRCLKYLQLLQGRGHARGPLRNQNESPHTNVSDCCGTMQCCQRKFPIALVLLDEDSWLWLEPVTCEQRGKGNFCGIWWCGSYCSSAEPGTWLCVSFCYRILEKALALFPNGNDCPALPQPLLIWNQVWYNPASSPISVFCQGSLYLFISFPLSLHHKAA